MLRSSLARRPWKVASAVRAAQAGLGESKASRIFSACAGSGVRCSWPPVLMRAIGLTNKTLRALSRVRIERSPAPMVDRGLPEAGSTWRTSAEVISRSEAWPWPAQVVRAGMALRR